MKRAEDAASFVNAIAGSIPDRRVDPWFGVDPVGRDVTSGRGKVQDVIRLTVL